MPDLKTLPSPILIHIATILQVPMKGLLAVIELLDDGATVPFIARYRKEVTGNLDELQIRNIEEKLLYFRELESRRATILASIQEQGKLTGELRQLIEATLDKSQLEDLYLPYKPKRRTKATIAREKGMEPLAAYLWEQQPTGTPLSFFAASFVNPELGVASVEDALEGARHIVSETISDHAEVRKALRKAVFEEGVIVSKKSPGEPDPDPQQKFKMYYDYREPARTIPSHRMLAIRRGESESVLYFLIEFEPQRRCVRGDPANGLIVERRSGRRPFSVSPTIRSELAAATSTVCALDGKVGLVPPGELFGRNATRYHTAVGYFLCRAATHHQSLLSPLTLTFTKTSLRPPPVTG